MWKYSVFTDVIAFSDFPPFPSPSYTREGRFWINCMSYRYILHSWKDLWVQRGQHRDVRLLIKLQKYFFILAIWMEQQGYWEVSLSHSFDLNLNSHIWICHFYDGFHIKVASWSVLLNTVSNTGATKKMWSILMVSILLEMCKKYYN